MKTLRIVIAALLVLAIGALAGIGRPEAAESAGEAQNEGITVIGVGTVDAVPDEAEVSLGITTDGATARQALSANSVAMRRLIAALKAAGIAERDITTQNVSVSPDYDESKESVSSGFTATNSVSVRIREVDRAGAVLEAAANAGANQVGGPTLTRENRAGLEAKALEGAVENARKRAETLAGAANVELGRVTAISEQPEPGVIYEGARMAADSDAASVPIEKGTQQIRATVSVTFAIE